MCLAVPGKIISIEGKRAKVDVQGVVRETDLTLLPDAGVGDYVILHAGFALEKYSREQAEETWKLLREIADEKAG
jgi:hydrogenase expression/formation protein HypC